MALKLLVFTALIVASLADVDVLKQYFESQRRGDNTIFASSVIAQDTSGVLYTASGAFGQSSIERSIIMWTDNSVRINAMTELFVTIAALHLVEQSMLPSVDAVVPARYLPRAVSFFNPSYPSTPLTLKQLMTHTSTLTDDKFAQFLRTAPDSVIDFKSFIEAYFLQSSGGTFVVAPDVWTTRVPGSESSYRFARANVALLAYIIQQVIVEKPTLVAGTGKTVMSYIQEQILNPLGMTSTFFVQLDGALPQLTYPSANFLASKRVADVSAAGTPMTATLLHPAYPADYMMYSSVQDISRLVRSLFLQENGLFRTVGQRMREQSFSVATSEQSLLRRGQLRQGSGLFLVDGSLMCSIALASTVIKQCPLKLSSSVWGYMSVGQHSMVASFCTDTKSVVNPTCVTVTHSFYDTGSVVKPFDTALGMAAVAFQESMGLSSSLVQTTSSELESTDELYGLWVFLGVLGVIVFVLLAAYFTESVIQPAPIITGVALPQNVPPTAVGLPGSGVKQDTFGPM